MYSFPISMASCLHLVARRTHPCVSCLLFVLDVSLYFISDLCHVPTQLGVCIRNPCWIRSRPRSGLVSVSVTLTLLEAWSGHHLTALPLGSWRRLCRCRSRPRPGQNQGDRRAAARQYKRQPRRHTREARANHPPVSSGLFVSHGHGGRIKRRRGRSCCCRGHGG